MDDMKEYLTRRAAEMDLGRADQLAEIQAYLDERYGGQCRAVGLNEGVLKITTPNASLASELRLGQVELLGALAHVGATKIMVRIA